MQYSNEIFSKFRELAIVDPSKLEVGRTYYSNFREPFVVEAILTDQEMHRRWFGQIGLSQDRDYDNSEPAYIMHSDGSDWKQFEALHDNNIGNSYNPWLIFESEETAKACREQLVVTYEPDLWDDYVDSILDSRHEDDYLDSQHSA